MRNNALLDIAAETWVEWRAVVAVSAKEAHVAESGRKELLPGWNWWHDSIQTSARTALSKEAWWDLRSDYAVSSLFPGKAGSFSGACSYVRKITVQNSLWFPTQQQ